MCFVPSMTLKGSSETSRRILKVLHLLRGGQGREGADSTLHVDVSNKILGFRTKTKRKQLKSKVQTQVKGAKVSVQKLTSKFEGLEVVKHTQSKINNQPNRGRHPVRGVNI